MGSRYEIEVTIRSARDLKNVNWRHGDLRPYAVAWIEPSAKCSTKVDIDHDTDPVWDEKLTIPLPPQLSLRDAILSVDIVHADADEGTKPLIGSARLPLPEVVDEAGIGGKLDRNLKLKRPSGRPHGRLDLRIAIKEPHRYYDPYPAPPPAYGQSYASRDPAPPPAYGQPYASRDPYGYAPQPPPGGYPYGAPPPGGNPYGAPPPGGNPYGGAPPAGGYPYGGSSAYGGSQPGYGQSASGSEKKSKFGMGTGLAVGAAAGVLGGLALAEGADYLEDKFEDHVAEKVEDDVAGDYDY